MANFYNARYTKLSRYASSINLSLPAQSAINMFCRKRASSEIQLQWALKNSDAEHYGLQLGTGMRLYIDNQSERLVLWRYYPHENLDGYRSIPLPQRDTLALRIFIDTSSVEVFINDGKR